MTHCISRADPIGSAFALPLPFAVAAMLTLARGLTIYEGERTPESFFYSEECKLRRLMDHQVAVPDYALSLAVNMESVLESDVRVEAMAMADMNSCSTPPTVTAALRWGLESSRRDALVPFLWPRKSGRPWRGWTATTKTWTWTWTSRARQAQQQAQAVSQWPRPRPQRLLQPVRRGAGLSKGA